LKPAVQRLKLTPFEFIETEPMLDAVFVRHNLDFQTFAHFAEDRSGCFVRLQEFTGFDLRGVAEAKGSRENDSSHFDAGCAGTGCGGAHDAAPAAFALNLVMASGHLPV